MPGAPFLHARPGISADPGQGAPSLQAAAQGAGSHATFLIWYVLIGFVLPLLIFQGYRVGGFQFVFRSR